jgi:thioredoxin reductase (NADPH)
MDYATQEILGDPMGVTAVSIRSNKTGETKKIDVMGVFVFVGRTILNDTLKQQDGSFLCKMSQSGEVVVDLKMNTSIKGLFAAGDIRINAPKQVVCAASDGAIAAIEAISYLQ